MNNVVFRRNFGKREKGQTKKRNKLVSKPNYHTTKWFAENYWQ